MFVALECLLQSLFKESDGSYVRPVRSQIVTCTISLLERLWTYAMTGNCTCLPYALGRLTFLNESIVLDGKPTFTPFLKLTQNPDLWPGHWIQLDHEQWPLRSGLPLPDSPLPIPYLAASRSMFVQWGKNTEKVCSGPCLLKLSCVG